MINVEENLRELCRRKGLRLSDVADRMCCGQSNLVSSVKGNPKLSTLQEIADALNISVSELLTMRPDSAQGIVILGGQTYQLSKPAVSTVQLPAFDHYDALRKEIKDFIKKSIKSTTPVSKMGLVETLEVFSLVYDPSDSKFFLSLCYADGQTATCTYDKFEFCNWRENDTEETVQWNVPEIAQEIINDIEGLVTSKLQSQ